MINKELRSIIESQGSIYKAAHSVAAKTGIEPKTAHQRISRYVSDRPPETIIHLEQTLNALGYEIVIRERGGLA